MSCVKEMAMREPLVDTVDPNQIVTNHYPLIVCLCFTYALSRDVYNLTSYGMKERK